MLRLEHVGAGLGVLPITVAGLVIVSLHLLDAQPVVPRMRDKFVFTLEVILVVALRAHEGTHFLARRFGVRLKLPFAAFAPPTLDTRQVRRRVVRPRERTNA